jgi:hypothetical protein
MSSKNLKRIRRVLKFRPMLDPIDDIAWEQCFKIEKAYEKWIWDACLILYQNPSYPIEKLTPNQMLKTIFTEVFEQLLDE